MSLQDEYSRMFICERKEKRKEKRAKEEGSEG
jgi:hypothetical protein